MIAVEEQGDPAVPAVFGLLGAWSAGEALGYLSLARPRLATPARES